MDEDVDGPRVGSIRAAVNTIRCGTAEITEVMGASRGTLSKSIIRGLSRRMKDLRQTAEAAEEQFRQWTVDLSDRPSCVERAEHDILRAQFEVEVVAIHKCMKRVADEAVQMKSKKKAAAEVDESAAEQTEVDEDERPLGGKAPLPRRLTESSCNNTDGGDGDARGKSEISDAVHASSPPVSVEKELQLAAHSEPPPRQVPLRSLSDNLSSHTTVANAFKAISSLEEECSSKSLRKQQFDTDFPATRHVVAGGRSKPEKPEKTGGIPTIMKVVLLMAIGSLGYNLFTHARFLAIATEPIEHVKPASPRLLR